MPEHLDWSRASVTIKVPAVFTATEDTLEVELSLDAFAELIANRLEQRRDWHGPVSDPLILEGEAAEKVKAILERRGKVEADA